MSALDVFGTASQITTYSVRLQVLDKMVGGVPSSPSVIKGWLKQRLELGDQALQEVVDETLKERFPDRQPTADELAGAVMEAGVEVSVNGFKRMPETGELAYEGRCMKAAMKEWSNSAYPGTEFRGSRSWRRASGRD